MRGSRPLPQRQERGATILIAMLLFLACTMATSAVLAASTAAAGSLGAMAAEDQKYYAVASAVEYFQTELDTGEVNHTLTRKVTHTYYEDEDGDPVLIKEEAGGTLSIASDGKSEKSVSDYSESKLTYTRSGHKAVSDVAEYLTDILLFGTHLTNDDGEDETAAGIGYSDLWSYAAWFSSDTVADRSDEKPSSSIPTMTISLSELKDANGASVTMDDVEVSGTVERDKNQVVLYFNNKTGQQAKIKMVLAADVDAYTDAEETGATSEEGLRVYSVGPASNKKTVIAYTERANETLHCDVTWSVLSVE